MCLDPRRWKERDFRVESGSPKSLRSCISESLGLVSQSMKVQPMDAGRRSMQPPDWIVWKSSFCLLGSVVGKE